jgi:hypothetical protein
MRETYTATKGRYEGESPMAEYLDSMVESDDSYSAPYDLRTVQRYGRRLLRTNHEGFIFYERHDTLDAAEQAFEGWAAEFAGEHDDLDEDEFNSWVEYFEKGLTL